MGFQQALAGLSSATKNLDVIGNNVSNASTVGYKAGQAQFADVFAASLAGSGVQPVGIGSKIAAVTQQFTQGNITTTNNPLDVAINGGGFFMVRQNGAASYSRNGQFQQDKDGYIVTNNGFRLAGYGASTNGAIGGAIQDLQIPRTPIQPSPTSSMNINMNFDSSKQIPSVTPFDYTDASTYNNTTSTTIYDSTGAAHTYSMYFVKTAANTWDVYSVVTNSSGTATALNSGAAVSSVTFSTAGAITSSPTTWTETVTSATAPDMLSTGAADLSFTVDLAGTTQYAGSFGVNTLSQDGYARGLPAGFNIGTDGIITGRYTNGQTKSWGQVILASFRNPQGLQPIGDNMWNETSASGSVITGTPGDSGFFGLLQSSSTEDSNVDLTQELVGMITAQRVYQANAQAIKTVDTVLQSIINIR